MGQLAPESIHGAGVDGLLANWAQVSRRRGSLAIDLGQIDRFERPAGALVANALLGSLGEVNLRVHLPSELDRLDASGIAFALANRPGPTRVLPEDRWSNNELWRRAWTPASQLPLFTQRESGTLFDPLELGEAELEPDLISKSFAAFIDPHLAGTASQIHPIAGAVWPWLDHLLPRSAKGWSAADNRRRRFISDVGRLLSEMVVNVSEHAHWPGTRLHSFVQITFTRGGSGSFNRLYVSVQDNGAGVAATARPKMQPKAASSLNDHQLIFKLFDGSLPPWDRGRGLGLPCVSELVRRHSGWLAVATGTTRLRVTGSSPRLVSGPAGYNLQGTVLVTMLKLPTR